MRIIVATIKSWNVDNAKELQQQYIEEHDIKIIDKKEDLTTKMLEEFNPEYIFFPHWSYMIPAEIYEQYKCVVFHMTDLPFGRGGSPLQNLIVRGYKETKISAIKVTKEIDAGPIYMKENLDLSGSAEEIFKRASEIIFTTMIPLFLKEHMEPVEQVGEGECFVRRTPVESELQSEMTIETVYDYIRMLDAEGYPNAYIKLGSLKFTFKNAKKDGDKISAFVQIMEEKE